jgi:hydroxymethylbilane synthase
MKRVIRIGSRGSALAWNQALEVQKRLKAACPTFKYTLVKIKTEGDRNPDTTVFDHGQTGIFTKTIEKKLLSKEVDLAVHSLKDLPTTLPAGLKLVSFLKREDARDVLVTHHKKTLGQLKRHAVVGTSSLRRARQLKLMRKDLWVLPMRGNLDTRLKAVKTGRMDAIVIALAGLKRLKLKSVSHKPFDLKKMLPCVGQGILGVEARISDHRLHDIVRRINHLPTENEARCERSFLKVLQGGCRVPAGAFAKQKGRHLELNAAVFSTQSSKVLRVTLKGLSHQAELLGKKAAQILKKKGAIKFLREARS